jgi:hypothetical protein
MPLIGGPLPVQTVGWTCCLGPDPHTLARARQRNGDQVTCVIADLPRPSPAAIATHLASLSNLVQLDLTLSLAVDWSQPLLVLGFWFCQVCDAKLRDLGGLPGLRCGFSSTFPTAFWGYGTSLSNPLSLPSSISLFSLPLCPRVHPYRSIYRALDVVEHVIGVFSYWW